MTWDSVDQEPQPRAGLFGKRFGRRSAHTFAWTDRPEWFEASPDTSEWFQANIHVDEADIRLVDSTIDIPSTAAEAASGASYDAPDDRTTFIPSPGLPQRSAQVLWEIILPLNRPKSLPQELECTKQSLQTALYPPAPPASPWLRRLTRRSIRKKPPQEALALELVGTQERLQLFLRGPVPGIARLFDHLRASHEHLERAIADTEYEPEADPLTLQPGEAMSFAELHLKNPAILPLKTAETYSLEGRGDPLAGLLSVCAHMADLSRSVRVVSQLLVTQAPQRWKQRNQALLERQRAQRAAVIRSKPINQQGQDGLVLLILLGIGYLYLSTHGLLFLLWMFFLPLVIVLGSLLLVWRWRRWSWARLLARHEQEVVAKLSQEVAQVCLRLYVIGPVEAPHVREAALDRLIGAYGAFASLNRWKVGKRQQLEGVALAHSMLDQLASMRRRRDLAVGRDAAHYLALFDLESAFRPQSWWQRLHFFFRGDQVRPVLGMNEVAALWHLPSLDELPDSYDE